MNNDSKKFTDSTFWKIIMTILVILLSIFFIFGLIGRLIQVIIKNQQKRVDKLMSKLILSKVVNNEKDFKRIANYKSRVYFFKHALPAVLIMLFALLCYIVSISIFLSIDGNEYVSMFYIFGRTIFPWKGEFNYFPPLGFDFSKVYADLPFDEFPLWYGIMSMITIGILVIGLCYYFFEVQGYLARKFRIKKLALNMFTKNLDDIDLMHFINTVNSTILDDKEKTTLPANLDAQSSQDSTGQVTNV